ncbi:MAG: hypothetical protein O3A00_24760 [Planctomycetota bacterium]|nr:hypothetical protein [Planctomycetota bacterium]
MYIDPGREPVSQGDIIEGCPLYGLDPRDPSVDTESRPQHWVARVIVLTQACDAAQPKIIRLAVATVHDAQALVADGVLKASLIRDQIRRHLVHGWYFLPESEFDVHESVVDLRNIHTVPRTILEQLAGTGKRICRLDTPYREHMNQHFGHTYARIGLPEPYKTKS